MIRPDFSKFTNLSESVIAGNSEIVWREFLISAFSFINHCSHKVNEEELSEITKSLQNWTFKRKYIEYKEYEENVGLVSKPIHIGDIFIADLGMNYELAYCHPVLVIDIIDNRILIIPVTSSGAKVQNAYHPKSNSSGDKRYRKVYKSDGFDDDSALILNEIRVISQGRLIEKKGSLNEDITLPESIFQEVKESSFSMVFEGFYNEKISMSQELAELKEKIIKLEEKTGETEESEKTEKTLQSVD